MASLHEEVRRRSMLDDDATGADVAGANANARLELQSVNMRVRFYIITFYDFPRLQPYYSRYVAVSTALSTARSGPPPR